MNDIKLEDKQFINNITQNSQFIPNIIDFMTVNHWLTVVLSIKLLLHVDLEILLYIDFNKLFFRLKIHRYLQYLIETGEDQQGPLFIQMADEESHVVSNIKLKLAKRYDIIDAHNKSLYNWCFQIALRMIMIHSFSIFLTCLILNISNVIRKNSSERNLVYEKTECFNYI